MPQTVSSLDIGGFQRRCVTFAGATPPTLERFVLENLQGVGFRTTKLMTETLVVLNPSDCSRLTTFSWGPPETAVDVKRYEERRAALFKEGITAALVVTAGQGRRTAIYRGQVVQVNIAETDPTRYEVEHLTCSLIHLSGGQPVESGKQRRVVAFVKCNVETFDARLAKLLVEKIRTRTGIGRSGQTRLFIQVNDCAAFQDLEFPVAYLFDESSFTRSCVSAVKSTILSWRGRTCIARQNKEADCVPE